ncbi:MAG: peptide ABC transporter permease, partial [Brevinematales bacterium]
MGLYFFRRFLLIFPTLFGITIACFLIMQAVPGGPIEQALQRIKKAQQESGQGGLQSSMTAEELENIKHY